jgi:hypothetical protein
MANKTIEKIGYHAEDVSQVLMCYSPRVSLQSTYPQRDRVAS